MLFVEGKIYSQEAQLGSMAQKIADFELNQANCSQSEEWYEVHRILRDEWSIMNELIDKFPEGQRPTPIEILTARGDQRKPVE